MDTVSPAFLNGVGVVGVVLFLMVAFIRGWFVTKREADSYLDRAQKAEAARDRALEQNAELMEWARLGKATFKSLREAAEEPQ